MVSEGPGPGENILNLPYKAVACRSRCRGFGHLVAAAQVVREGVAIVSPEGKIQTQGGAELEVFDNLKFPAETAHELVGPALCSRKRERCNRVHHLIVASARDGIHPSVLIVKHPGSTVCSYLSLSLFVGAGNIENRRKSHGGAQRRAPGGVGGHSRTGDICIGEIAAEGEFVEEITLFGLVHHLVGGVAAQSEAVVVGTAVVSSDYTVLTDVAKRKIVVNLVGSAADAELMLILWSIVIEKLSLPVRTLAVGGRVPVDRSHSGIHRALIHHCGILAGVEHIKLLPRA